MTAETYLYAVVSQTRSNIRSTTKVRFPSSLARGKVSLSQMLLSQSLKELLASYKIESTIADAAIFNSSLVE